MKSQHYVLKLLTLITMLSLIMACSTDLGSKSAAPSITLNGEKIENSGLVQKDDAMYIPASFITDTLGATFETPEEGDVEAGSEELAEGVYYTNKVGVLMYHAVMEDPTDGSIIAPEQFRDHLQWLKDEGFNPISMEQYVAFIHEGGEVPDNAVLITFDDGYENFYTYAYPALKEFDYPAVNFVIVSGVDDPSIPGIKKLSWDQMREMKEHNIAFHNHTFDMHVYGAVNAEGIEQPVAISNLYLPDEKRVETDEEYIARVTEDLSKAEQRLEEELGNTIRAIAFPYGAYNERLLGILDELDIKTSFTVKPGINTSEDALGFRINGGRSDKTAEELLAGLKPEPVELNDNAMLLNGKLVSFSKIIEAKGDQPALYPLREVSNALGLFIGWDSATKTVTLAQ